MFEEVGNVKLAAFDPRATHVFVLTCLAFQMDFGITSKLQEQKKIDNAFGAPEDKVPLHFQISEATAAAGSGLIELRRIEAAREIAGTLSQTPNVAYLPSGGNMLLGLNPGAPEMMKRASR